MSTAKFKIKTAQFQLGNSIGMLKKFSIRKYLPGQRLKPLLFSTLFAEIAGNMVYVGLLERAYVLGNGPSSVGGVLVVQSAAQVIFGIWAGSLVDKFGKRRSAIIATLLLGILVLAIVFCRGIYPLYITAFLVMFSRLLLITSRLSLVSRVSKKKTLIKANMAISMVNGAGLFLGPALSAAAIVFTGSFETAMGLAILGYLLSFLYILFVPKESQPKPIQREKVLEEIYSGWQYIRSHTPIRKALFCLINGTLIIGTILPLITPLSHRLGMGAEGTGIFFSALGLGALFGPLTVVILSKRISLTTSLLITGLLAPVGVFSVGLLDSVTGSLIAIGFISSANAALNVIVFSIIQRLTPQNKQGRVFGVEQAFAGLAWMVSQSVSTILVSNLSNDPGFMPLFYLFGVYGVGSVFICWLWNRNWIQTIKKACQINAGEFSVYGKPFHNLLQGAGGFICRIICGRDCRCIFEIGNLQDSAPEAGSASAVCCLPSIRA